jgi:MoxR-like ATPase
MPIPLRDLRDGDVIQLPERGGMPASVHVIHDKAIQALRAAIVTGRPLLVRGDPGTGKSQLARAAAEALGRAFVSHAVDARTETRDLLWSVDAIARLARAQVLGALRGSDLDAAEKSIDVLNFLHPGALWWAFDWPSAALQAERVKESVPETPKGWEPARGVVVLVDEIDKADPAVPNGLLDALGHRRFDVPGRGPVALDQARTPLVVITTNEERALPDAFLRRCWVLHLALPTDRDELLKTLMARGKAHFPACDDKVLKEAAVQLAKDRERIQGQRLGAPGLAEYVDVLHALTQLATTPEEQLRLLKEIAGFAFDKHPPEPMA